MNVKPAVLFLLFSAIPAFVGGWFWSATSPPNTEKPVMQVIRAIESRENPISGRSPSPETAAIFDSLHERTVASFVNTFKSFGFTRVMKVEELRHTDLWTLHPGRDDGFAVALIGLDREAPVRFDRLKEGNPPDRLKSPVAILEGLDSLAATASKGPRPLSPGEEKPLDSLDLAGVKALRESEHSARAIFSEHRSVTAYGPIRATGSCLRCHDGDAGDLLGVFRYTFPMPEQSLRLQLAGNP